MNTKTNTALIDNEENLANVYWQTELQYNITSVEQLATHLPLSEAERSDLEDHGHTPDEHSTLLSGFDRPWQPERSDSQDGHTGSRGAGYGR